MVVGKLFVLGRLKPGAPPRRRPGTTPSTPAPARVRYSIEEWLKGFSSATGYLDGISVDALLEAVREHGFADDERFEAELFTELLFAIAGEQHARWLYADARAWDHARGRETLPAMLGLPVGVIEPINKSEPLGDYAFRLNERARTLGKPLRLYELACFSSEQVVVIAAPPLAMARLLGKEYLVAWPETA